MTRIKWRDWGWQYALPFAVFAGGLVLTLVLGRVLFGAEDPDMLYFFVIAPLLAVGIGLIMQPKHVWLVPALAVIALIATTALNRGVSEALSISLNFVFLVGVPLTLLIWLGKYLRPKVSEWLTHSSKPNLPST